MQPLTDLVIRAQRGDVEAYARLVEATQRMVQGVALSVLRDSTTAQDASQQAYLRAFRRLSDLQEPASFAGWLRRIVITVAFNMRRARRLTFVTLDDIPDVPVLDESESRWSEAEHRLASALLSLTPEGGSSAIAGITVSGQPPAWRRTRRGRAAMRKPATHPRQTAKKWKWRNNAAFVLRGHHGGPPGQKSWSFWPHRGLPTVCRRTQ